MAKKFYGPVEGPYPAKQLVLKRIAITMNGLCVLVLPDESYIPIDQARFAMMTKLFDEWAAVNDPLKRSLDRRL